MLTDTKDTQRPRLTVHEAKVIWEARESHEVDKALGWCFLAPILAIGLWAILQGRWDNLMGAVGLYALVRWGLPWLLCQGLQAARKWWQPLVLALVLSATVTGCAEMDRTVMRLHGYDPDAYPRMCRVDNLHTGVCVPQPMKGQ